VSMDAGIKPRTVAVYALMVNTANY
jgi:hypothetical protein